jgi:hypothetical protein
MASPYKLTGTNTILDLVKAAGTAETYRDSVNKSYAKPWKLFSSPPDSVWQEYKELEHDRDTKRYDIYHNPNPTEGLIKYSQTESDATGVAHDNIDGILAGNRQDKLEKLVEREGSISALPYLETEEGQQTLMDIAMGSAFPGAAVGRVSKAAITGGGATAKSLQKSLQSLFNPKQFRAGKPMPKFDKEVLGRIDAETEVGVARSAWEKAMKKWGIGPDERAVFDPVTEVLRSQKGSRFSPYRKN